MKKLMSVVGLCLGVMSLSACAPQTMYSWGKYDSSMYAYARDTDRQVEFQEALFDVIEQNETDGKKVPPGIYAEYGYQMLEMGRDADAVKFFQREKAEWPESKAFMDMMIAYTTGHGTLKDASDQVSEAKIKQPDTAKTVEIN